MKIVVTGAAGFIGSHLAERLLQRGEAVIGFDNFDPFYPRAVKERNLAGLRSSPGFSLVEGDLRDPAALTTLFSRGADVVVHLAALAGVRPSLIDPKRYFEVNLTGTMNLLEAARAAGTRRVVFGSSSSVYRQGSATPFRESDACARPLSPYAASKRAGELIAFTEHHLHGAAMTCLRFFTVYGPRQRPDLAIHKFTRLIASDQPIELFGDGETSRDYTWIDDIVDGVIAAVDQQAIGPSAYRIYNLGGSRPTSLRALVERLAAALGKEPRVVWKPEQPGDMKRTLADVSLAARDLGYAPKVSAEDGLPRFVAWFLSERDSSSRDPSRST